MLMSECMRNNSDIDQTESVGESVNHPSDDFFISYASRREIRRKSTDTIIEDEVNRYIDDERNEYLILNEYPNIRKVFFKHNTS